MATSTQDAETGRRVYGEDVFNSIKTYECRIGEPGSTRAVTQATSITTAVTLNQAAGVITTVAVALSTADSTFTLENTLITADSLVIPALMSKPAGIVIVSADSVAAGSCTITLRASAAVASGTYDIAFVVH